MPVPLDEYPLHQSPQSLAFVGSSDRNFYDRCYFNAHDRDGGTFLVTGLGYYPNLGVYGLFQYGNNPSQAGAVNHSSI